MTRDKSLVSPLKLFCIPTLLSCHCSPNRLSGFSRPLEAAPTTGAHAAGINETKLGWMPWQRCLYISLSVHALWLCVPPSTSPAACETITLMVLWSSRRERECVNDVQTCVYVDLTEFLYLPRYQYNIPYSSDHVPIGAFSLSAQQWAGIFPHFMGMFILDAITVIFLGTLMCYLYSNCIN